MGNLFFSLTKISQTKSLYFMLFSKKGQYGAERRKLKIKHLFYDEDIH